MALGIPWHRGAQLLEPAPHHQLVLGVHQRVRRRRHIDPLGDQLVQQFGRDVLVVEGQRVGAGGDAAQVVQIGVRADDDVGGDLRGRFVGGGGQHPQRLAQRDRGLVRHPGELPAADHRNLGVPPACGGRSDQGAAGTRHGHLVSWHSIPP